MNTAYSRLDDPRIGDRAQAMNVEALSSAPAGLVLVGYPDDQGIRLNLGRPGAKEAPSSIRRAFFKMADLFSTPIYDLGDLLPQDRPEQSHENALRHLNSISPKHLLVSLGGGHDYAYPDVMNFLTQNHTLKPLVVNIDAHLDVRTPDPHIHSGTPFYRLLEEGCDFDLVQVGIQEPANSLTHRAYCHGKNVTVVFNEDCDSFPKFVRLTPGTPRPCFLSVDMDGFSSAIAPGVSSPSPLGLDWNTFLKILTFLHQNTDIKGLGIYETSPPLDRDDQTAKLAASIIHKLGVLKWKT